MSNQESSFASADTTPNAGLTHLTYDGIESWEGYAPTYPGLYSDTAPVAGDYRVDITFSETVPGRIENIDVQALDIEEFRSYEHEEDSVEELEQAGRLLGVDPTVFKTPKPIDPASLTDEQRREYEAGDNKYRAIYKYGIVFGLAPIIEVKVNEELAMELYLGAVASQAMDKPE